MEPSAQEEENVDHLFEGRWNFDKNNDKPNTSPQSQPLPEAPLPEQIPTDTTANTAINASFEQEQNTADENKQQQESKNEFILIDDKYDDTADNNNSNNELASIAFPVVDSLQPDELCLCIQDTITKISQLDPLKDHRLIMAYKANLIQQFEKLQNISSAIDSLNNMQITAENLPKNNKTGYANIEAINLALREHSFFAEQLNTFGMLLIEISDINKLKDKYSTEYTSLLLQAMCDSIKAQFIYSHLLFHYSANRLVLLIYIENEQELMMCGQEVIRLLSSHSYEIKDQILHSNISVGAAIYMTGNNKEESDPFDFRTWLQNAELGLNKANNCGLHNQCGISKDDDVIKAIIPNMKDSDSGSNHNKHNKSTLSLLARARDRGHSSGSPSYPSYKIMANKLTPKQIRASIRLYDKLSRLQTEEDSYKLLALSLCRRLKQDGANYNFQHPKYNGNSILMLCCQNNVEIIIKYFCLKLAPQEIDFNLINNEGNNALMIAILNKNVSNEVIQLISDKTTDKLLMNHNGQTTVQLAQKMDRNDLIACLQ